MTDILERLKATTKINGAYPRDIEDAIKEIELLRNSVKNLREMYKDMQEERNWYENERDKCLSMLIVQKGFLKNEYDTTRTSI